MVQILKKNSFWNTQRELIDYFEPNIDQSDYSPNAICIMQNNYDLLEHKSAECLISFLEELNNFCQLMRPDNMRLTNNESMLESVYSLFDALYDSMDHLSILQKNSLRESAVYASALKYAHNLFANYVEMLEESAPNSLALKWFQDYQSQRQNKLSI